MQAFEKNVRNRVAGNDERRTNNDGGQNIKLGVDIFVAVTASRNNKQTTDGRSDGDVLVRQPDLHAMRGGD